MFCIPAVCCFFQPRAMHGAGRLRAWWRGLLVLCVLNLGVFAGVRAENIQLESLAAVRAEDGVLVDFATRFELTRAVEDALHKGVPLHFVAEAELYRARWYWRDHRVTTATRTWRLAWQPLTLSYRVSFGALNQSYPTLAEAVAAIQRSARWHIADPINRDDDGRYYVEFSYRLETALLPRPMQIGIARQADWQLMVERSVPVGSETAK